MSFLKNIGLGAAIAATGAMLMGTPITPKLNTTPSHINFATGFEDPKEERETLEKCRIYDSKGLDCSKDVIRYVDTNFSYGYKVFNYSKYLQYKGIGTSRDVIYVTDDLEHPTFTMMIYNQNIDVNSSNYSHYKKVGSSYYLFADYNELTGVHQDHYYYPGYGNEDGFIVYYVTCDSGVLQ